VIGSQYEYLARYAKQQNIKFEVGIEFSPRSKAATALKGEGGLVKANHVEHDDMRAVYGGYWHLDATKASTDMMNIFGNMQFPELLFSIDKLEEIRLMREWGLNEVVMSTWFCHNPVFGKPCGHCSPCRDALNEGLVWRVPMSGRILGALRVPFLFARSVFGVLHRRLKC
jgi:7-cyano-7-deazaguanine synthase